MDIFGFLPRPNFNSPALPRPVCNLALPWRCGCELRQPRLRSQTNRCVRRTKARVVAPLHDFEEEATVESRGVDLEIFAAAGSVVEHVVGAQPLQRVRRDIEPGLE